MKLRDIGEFSFIDRISPGCIAEDGGHVLYGIGDDAAVIESGDGVQVITTDMLVEGVHFDRDTVEPAELGRKALAVNLSDIAAMGATPRDALVSIAAPPDLDVDELEEFYAGMKLLASSTGVSIVGGDTTASRGGMCVAVTAIGIARRDQVLYRSGARVGDHILVTGTLGDAAGGLRILTDGPDVPPEVSDYLRSAHVDPRLYLPEARIFAEAACVGAAIDISDGIASDLGHVCRASGVGAVLDVTAIPISEQLRTLCGVTGCDPLELALTGGEDYRLLVTVETSGIEMLRALVADATGCTLFDVGEIVDGDSVEIRLDDGTERAITETGWDGFRSPDRLP